MKKTSKDQGGAKAQKLQLKKETVKDLGSLKAKAAAVKGGAACGGCSNRTCGGWGT
jgi:hypothetical protein